MRPGWGGRRKSNAIEGAYIAQEKEPRINSEINSPEIRLIGANGEQVGVGSLAAANKVAYLDGGGWHALGSGRASGGASLGQLVRSLAADGTDVYVEILP